MKGLILAAGLGTRLRPLSSLRPKHVVAVANKPLIVHVIDNMVAAGISDIGIVVSPNTLEPIRETLEGYRRASLTYIPQNPPLGLAHAVKVSRDFLGDDTFVMYLADNLFENGISDVVEAFEPGRTNAVLALTPVEDPRAVGVAVVEDGRITQLVEKPQDPPSNLAVAGIYVFDSSIHAMIEGLEPGAKGEYQITDAVARLIAAGKVVKPVRLVGWWKDTGRPEDILDANRLVLLKLEGDIQGELEHTEVIGDVVIEAGAKVCRSTIVGPAIIGAGALIEDAYIGPYSSIGRDVVIRDVELEYVVVEQQSRIESVKARIQSSLIGVRVTISGRDERPHTHQLIVGDESKVQLQE